MIRYEASGGQRSRNAQALVAGRQPDAIAQHARADERQFVGRGGAVAGPDAGRGKLADGGEVIGGAAEHPVKNGLVHGGVLAVELPR